MLVFVGSVPLADTPQPYVPCVTCAMAKQLHSTFSIHESNQNIMHKICCTCNEYDIPFTEYIHHDFHINSVKHNLEKYWDC